jgi:hypothetical protein
MKKLSFLAFVVFALSVSGIKAQSLHIGLKGGINLSQMNGRSFNDGFKWGFAAGGFVELGITSKWGLQPELLFSQTNTQTASSFSQVYPQAGAINYQNVSLNYLTIPVLISWKPIPVLSFQLGPQFGTLLNSTPNIVQAGQKAFKSGDFAIAAGAQLNLLKFKIGARYVSSLTDLDNVGNSDTWKNETIQFYIGFRLL